MSVERDGVRGYEYQYLVTLYLALRYIDRFGKNKSDNLKIFVEVEEDAKILYLEQSTIKALLIQVKQHKDAVDLDDFCNWLAHFGDKQADNFLFSKIKDENIRVFIITNGRCKDALVPYLQQTVFEDVGSVIDATETVQISSAHVLDVKERLLASHQGDTQLEKKRNATIESFFNVTNKEEQKNILKRISIAELQSVQKVKELVAKLLNTQFEIKGSHVESVIYLLHACVTIGRDQRTDIFPQIFEILQKYRQKLLPPDLKYISIPQQQLLEQQLQDNHVLLMTGMPFCGKTVAAKYIAQLYAAQGFTVFYVHEIDDGYKFLNQCNDESKVLLVEDPFGSIHINNNKTEILRKLEELINTKPTSKHKLIVTSRKDILLEAFEQSTIEHCSIGKHLWVDLSIKNLDFARDVWLSVYGTEPDSEKCFDGIADHIKRYENGTFLEIGEIFHLQKINYTNINVLLEKNAAEILCNARLSSKGIADKISATGLNNCLAFIALGLTCNTIRETDYRGPFDVLSHVEQDFVSDLTKDFEQILLEFETYGFITIDRTVKSIRFLHPVYSFAAKLLFQKLLQKSLDTVKLFNMVQYAAIDASKNVNLSALEFIHDFLQFDITFKNDLTVVALKALDSKYPTVRDKAVLLLEEYFYELGKDEQQKILHAVENSFSDEYTLWENGEAVRNHNSLLWNDFVDSCQIYSKNALQSQSIEKIENKYSIKPLQVYSTLKIQENLPVDFLTLALAFDENFIRAEAIYLLFKKYAGKINIKSYLLEGEDCNVVCHLFKGALESWFSYTKTEREEILSYFINKMKRVTVALQAKSFLEDFAYEQKRKTSNREAADEETNTLLWEAWCVVFAELLNNVRPEYIKLSEARMVYCLEGMLDYVKKQDLLNIFFRAWLNWLDRMKFADDYGMSLAEFIVTKLDVKNPERLSLLSDMLKTNDTNKLTSHITHLVNCWEKITETERNIVIALLSSERNDVKWLRSIVLTRDIVPECLQEFILGKTIANENDYDSWYDAVLNAGLMEYCLNIYCGYPQPLWWNGYHHMAKKRWQYILAKVLRQYDLVVDRSFRIALHEFMHKEYEKTDCFLQYREDIWNALLCDGERRKAVFEYLLLVTVTVNNNGTALWHNYFKHCTEEEALSSCETIAKYIEAVELYQDEDELIDLYKNSILLRYLYKYLYGDYKVYQILSSIVRLVNTNSNGVDNDIKNDSTYITRAEKDKVKVELLQIYKESPPRMRMTRNFVLRIITVLQLECKELETLVEEQRRKITEVAFTLKKDKRFDDSYRLENWNDGE